MAPKVSLGASAMLFFACGTGTRGPTLLEVGSGAPVDAGSDGSPSDDDASCSVCRGVIVVKDRSTSSQHGGLDAGTPYSDECPDNQVITGFRGTLADAPASTVSSLVALCGELVAGGAEVGEIPIVHAGTLPERGKRTGSTWEQSCPANAVVTGFSGRAGSALDQVKFQCSRLLLSRTSADRYALSLDPATIELNPPIGGAGGSPFQAGCPPGQVARGSNVRASDSVDAFGLICGTPSFAFADTFQGEGATLAGGTFVNTNHADYTGTGYVDGYWNPGASTLFAVDLPADQAVDATVRYANGFDTTQTLTVYVNGQRALQTALPGRGSWDLWGLKTERLNLHAGANTIDYRFDASDSAHVNIDVLMIVK
jgi:hypothetical protein